MHKCMCVSTYIICMWYVFTHENEHICAWVCMYVHGCMYACDHVHMFVHVWCLCFACACVSIRVCVHACA